MRDVLLRPRWLAGHLTVLVLAAIFVALGFWQLARDHQKQAKVRAERLAYDEPAPQLAANPGLADGARTQAEGAYDPAHQVLLRNQVSGSNVGDDVLTPLRLRDGSAVMIDRGWLPLEDAEHQPLPAPPAGPVVVRGLVHPARALSSQDSALATDGHLSLPRVDMARIGATVPYPLKTNWIEAQAQTPAPGPGAPQLPQPPPPDQVNHMEYAIEWFAFALIPLIGWPIVLVRIARRQQPEREPVSA